MNRIKFTGSFVSSDAGHRAQTIEGDLAELIREINDSNSVIIEDIKVEVVPLIEGPETKPAASVNHPSNTGRTQRPKAVKKGAA